MVDYSKEVFPISNFVLYSKGWYQPVNKGEDEFAFIKKILALDDYPFLTNEQDVVLFLLSKVDDYNEYINRVKFNGRILRLNIFESETNRYMITFGYNRQMAQIAAIKSFFLGIADIKLQKPIFNRKLYKKGIKFGNWKPGMTYKEMNKFVEKFNF